MSPLVRLRALIVRWRTLQVEQGRARARGEDVDPRRLAATRVPLGSGEARALLDECVTAKILDPVDHRALLTHLADAAAEELAHRREMPPRSIVADEVEVGGEPITLGAIATDATRWIERARLEAVLATVAPRARRWAETHHEIDETVARIEARGPKPPEETLDLEGWLDATDEATHEAQARALFALGLAGTRGIAAERTLQLVRGLRAAPLDALLSRDARMSRLGRALEPMGADPVFASRLRVEPSVSFGARSDVWLADPPRRVVIGVAPIELGVLSELDAIEAFARALSHASVSPAVPDEHRLTPRAEVPEQIGAIVALFLTEPRFLERRYGFDTRSAAALAIVATHALLVRARLDIARSIVRTRRLSTESDEADALAARCVGATSALPIGWLLASEQQSVIVHLAARARVCAAAAFVALRERHDEDFFRNPRTAETLAGASARGARLSRAEWLAELGARASPNDAARSVARERLG